MQRIFVKGIKGGLGSTSVVANLACVLKKSHVNVIAIDLDPKSDLGLHFGLPWKSTKGWSNEVNFEDVLLHFHQDSDGVIFLPFGDINVDQNDIAHIVNNCKKLDCPQNSWFLFDCPSYIDLAHLPLEPNDIVIELINCDATCHSLIYKRLKKLKSTDSSWKHYFLVNRYNSASVLEFDLFSLWQSTLPLMAPFFINSDEVIKESTAYRNVALNCAPYSIANDDFETLAGWLVSKAAL
ncbi:cellulose biosynthesis protein BcsQ [Pseudoalteromonas sp. MMG007]|uniref:cellulose biosynthesis protein BcsQ n=1 Tax=Pseudoalteromonas sp. MMG007 TaxID=2822684 RepID=UPI001B35849E|nr:cellulose biosynthesis protein BcsQ [Pseudoalteromonas sp. MMG007]MBQ4858013.1 cellulose synthase operon protein YhjQ [Pseudoalteromonas sp. MMG007]